MHGLGWNPGDLSVYAATHYGVWRIPTRAGSHDGTATPVRVADRYQDTMGFTVAGRDVLYGSRHPDLREDLPGLLGFLVSNDRAQTWKSVSLLGEVDFHDIAATGDRVYGWDSTSGRLLVSDDRGRSWTPRTVAQLRDLTVDPSFPDRLLATSASGLLASSDAGASFEAVPAAPTLVVVDWARTGR